MEISNEEILIYSALVVGVVGIGLFMYRKEIRFLFSKKEAQGVIVNWMSSTEKGVKYFYPMIEFESQELGKITFRAEERCANEPLYPPGTVVRILYLPGDSEFRKVIYPG